MKKTLLGLASAGVLLAQEDVIRFRTGAVGLPPGGPAIMMFDGHGGPLNTVKGAPYQADITSESTQTLADGNRIVNKTSSSFARDGEGRTRREIGPDEHKMIMIDDPVAGVHYVLDPREKTARKMTIPRGEGAMAIARSKERASWTAADSVEVRTPAPGQIMVNRQVIRMSGDNANVKTEQLGKSTMEGVAVTGTRTTMTIPAGEMGNERAITVTSEQWVSDELQTTISSKRSDPRMGESSMRATNLRRGEPARYLFEVPSDYKVVEGGGPGMQIERRIERKGPPIL
ncbi:MAG: hypothetical protein SFV18_12770 [Bryobacteraceae bacterium]|nr:hypothetical protein [Bryobacteraceae bacterium]